MPLKPRGEGEGGQAREVRPHGVEVLPVHGEGIAPGPEGEGGVGGGGEEEEVHLPEEGLGLGLEAAAEGLGAAIVGLVVAAREDEGAHEDAPFHPRPKRARVASIIPSTSSPAARRP